MGDASRGVDAELIGARHVPEQRHADLAIAFVSGDRSAEVGDRVAGGAAPLRQKVAAERLAVLAEIDAEGGADRAGGQLEQVAGDEGLAGILADRQILMQVGADPRRRLRRDRSFAEQVDRHAARRARIGIDAARGAVGTGLGIERLDQMRAPYLVAAPLVRSEEHTSELQSLMRISYAVFCLKKTK